MSEAQTPAKIEAWSDLRRGLWWGADLQATRLARLAHALLTLLTALWLLAIVGGTVLIGSGWLSMPWGWPLFAVGSQLALALALQAVRGYRGPEAFADRARRRDPALRACLPLVQDGRVLRTGRERLALEGWYEELPVQLELSIDLLRHAHAMARACGLRPAAEVRVTGKEGAAAEACPYCPDALGSVDVVACGACSTRHHAACLAELGRCTLHGCGRAGAAVRERAKEPL